VSPALVADTGGLLRALARRPDGEPSWPAYETALRSATAVIVPAPVLVEIDYFLRGERAAMRKLVSEIFDPATRYDYEPASPSDIVRALYFDAKFSDLGLGLVDGMVAAVAERRGVLRVLTTDRLDFGALRVGLRFDRALTLVP
jgi:predicted nucleic acid-binding protein